MRNPFAFAIRELEATAIWLNGGDSGASVALCEPKKSREDDIGFEVELLCSIPARAPFLYWPPQSS